MRPERCVYELFEIRQNIDLLSKKGDELVFNPAYNTVLAHYLKSNTLRLHNLTDVCNACGLCTPTIVQTEVGFRITRANYQPNLQELRKPMYAITNFLPEKGIKQKNIRVTIVDDRQPQELAEWLARKGYNSTAVWVNQNWNAKPDTQEQIVNAILQTGPHIVVCDKGLGFFDGIEIITAIRGYGVKTIMYTGEPDTRETHRVADAFVEKTLSIDELLNTVRSLE